MKTQFIKVSTLRKFINARGRKSSAEFVAAVDADVRNKVIAACNLHNGGHKTLDASVAGHVGFLRAASLAAPAAALLIMLFFGLALSSPAMGHFEALGQIETGNDDSAVGAAGEVSRYQILPSEWQAATNQMRGNLYWNPTDPLDAALIASRIWAQRYRVFSLSHHRAPTAFELYLLWSCPSKVDHPSKLKAEVATRFANLCADGPTTGHGLK